MGRFFYALLFRISINKLNLVFHGSIVNIFTIFVLTKNNNYENYNYKQRKIHSIS